MSGGIRQSIWATSHCMPTLLWLCQGQHPDGMQRLEEQLVAELREIQ